MVQKRMGRHSPSFTLIESLVALLIVAIVIQGLSFLMQWEKRVIDVHASEDQRISFQLCLSQLEEQGYLLNDVHSNSLTLSSRENNELKLLHVVKERLVLDGDRNGRMVLLGDVAQLRVEKHGCYQTLRVMNGRKRVFSGELLLPEKVRGNGGEQ
ncbi:prepilin-type N-terminal cleavage/methylation domain-containing protein [Fructobacillus sp. W13]|uniref:Prepilin-type N-terminal cleavage/methylation domain-containing protein n=1 Tax=Fructobacillus apis TaxID=2935017 RepID=A0ABT0ZPC0_9LACO|nr:prepilin-type N-terminal cleavage/methylation domain-containing protein [Fructobacillus apis]MCO0831812.1 prepilin-type N-terminal cleavage/methylation domain-containing protein [Fructobacillus apis]